MLSLSLSYYPSRQPSIIPYSRTPLYIFPHDIGQHLPPHYHPSQLEDPCPVLQIHHIVHPQRLPTPNHRPLPIHSKRPGLLPLRPHGRRHIVIVVIVLKAAPLLLDLDCTARVLLLYALGDLLPEPALLLPALDLRGRVEDVPDAAEPQPPGGIQGTVLVDDDLDGPGAAEEVDPFAGRLGGGVGDGDAADRAGVAVRERPEGEEGLLGDCDGLATAVQEWGSGRTYRRIRHTAGRRRASAVRRPASASPRDLPAPNLQQTGRRRP